MNNKPRQLEIWEDLSSKFDETLNQHEATLNELYKKLETLENSGKQLSDLCDILSTQNQRLKEYNTQIAERMQERDEDLAQAYADITRLEKSRRRFVVACTVLGGSLLITLFLLLKKLF